MGTEKDLDVTECREDFRDMGKTINPSSDDHRSQAMTVLPLIFYITRCGNTFATATEVCHSVFTRSQFIYVRIIIAHSVRL